MLSSLLLAACATVTPDLPAITDAPTGEHNSGMVVWRDLLTNTPEQSRTFYTELFGWTFERPGIVTGLGDDTYMVIRHEGKLIGGMLDTRVLKKEQNISQWITVISVNDVEAAASRVESNGGKVLTQPTRLATRGTLSIAEDPTGAIFALLQSNSGDPAVVDPTVNGFLWEELWTNDVSRATDFYREVVGYDSDDFEVQETDRVYRVLKTDDQPRAAIIANPFEGEMPVWVNYLRVADPSKITTRVEGLGGQIYVDTQDRPIGGKVAFIAGLSGAGVGLQTWPLD